MSFPLWVGIPFIVGGQPIPVGIGVYIKNVKEDLEKKHGFKAEKCFYGGHSMGASSIGSWAHANIDQVEGVFLWGSYIARSIDDPAKNFGAPVLTIGAEMDGSMARITRIALSFDQIKNGGEIGYENSKYTHPVLLIPGINRASFMTGVPPAGIQETDLRA